MHRKLNLYSQNWMGLSTMKMINSVNLGDNFIIILQFSVKCVDVDTRTFFIL